MMMYSIGKPEDKGAKMLWATVKWGDNTKCMSREHISSFVKKF